MFKVAIIVGSEVGNEYEAIRQCLEYFGISVRLIKIGRPADFISILNGKQSFQVDHLIFSFHGEKEAFVLPKLHPSVYKKGELRKNFGATQIEQYANFSGEMILTTACGLGSEAISEAFLKKGASTFIAPRDEIDGNTALLFIIRFYYELINHGKTISEAFEIAHEIDEEAKLMHYFTAQKN